MRSFPFTTAITLLAAEAFNPTQYTAPSTRASSPSVSFFPLLFTTAFLPSRSCPRSLPTLFPVIPPFFPFTTPDSALPFVPLLDLAPPLPSPSAIDDFKSFPKLCSTPEYSLVFISSSGLMYVTLLGFL